MADKSIPELKTNILSKRYEVHIESNHLWKKNVGIGRIVFDKSRAQNVERKKKYNNYQIQKKNYIRSCYE